MDAASKRISSILDTFSAEQEDDAKDDLMPSFVFNRSSRSFLGSLIGGRSSKRKPALTSPANCCSSKNSAALINSLCHYGLDIALLDPQSELPPPVADLLYFLNCERKCLKNNGDIFEVRTSAIDVKRAAIIKAFNEEKLFRVDNIGVDKRDNIAAAFGAVVAYFEAMPRPLIPFVFMNFVLSQEWYRLTSDEVTALRDDFVERLPLINYRIMRKLTSTLRQMSSWAYDKHGDEAPLWLVSTFRRHWTFYSIDKPTNNAIYVASFVALTVFRSGLGRFSPDNESLFHFRASCFLAQLMIHYEALFEPKRKRGSLGPNALSSDKCSRNEVGYESEQAELRLQQINALVAHLGRVLELSNHMGSIGDDAANRIGSVASIRKRADAVAIRLDGLGVDVLKNAEGVVKSTDTLMIYLDKHNLFSRHVSLSHLQTLLFNVRLDTSDYQKATTNLNLRDYLTMLVAIEAVICRLVARRFLETTDHLAELIANSTDFEETVSTAESVELIFEPAAPVLRRAASPAFRTTAAAKSPEPNGYDVRRSDDTKSEDISLNLPNDNSSSGLYGDVRSVIKTPSPSSDVDDFYHQTEEIIEISKRIIISGPVVELAGSDQDSSFADRTPTPETPKMKEISFEDSEIETSPPRDEATFSPRRFTLDEAKLNTVINNCSSRPPSSASIVSQRSSMIPGLHLGALYQGQSSPLVVPGNKQQAQRLSFKSKSPRSDSRSSDGTSNASSSSASVKTAIRGATPNCSVSSNSSNVSGSRSGTIQRKYQQSLETTI